MRIESIHSLSDSFGSLVFNALVQVPTFWEKFHPVLSPELFSESCQSDLIELVQGYWKKHKRVPRANVLKEIVKDSDYRDKGGMIKLIDDSLETEPENIEHIQEKIIESAKWLSIYKAVNSQNGHTPLEYAAEITKASRLGDDLLVDYLEVGSEVEELESEKVPTPWPWLNTQLGGGPSRGDLCVILTVVSGGKTTALVNLAMEATRQGRNVLYFSFVMFLVALMILVIVRFRLQWRATGDGKEN